MVVEGTTKGSDPTTAAERIMVDLDPTTATTRGAPVDSSPKAGAKRATIARFLTTWEAMTTATATTIRGGIALGHPGDNRRLKIFDAPLWLDSSCGMIASPLLPCWTYIYRKVMLSFFQTSYRIMSIGRTQ